MTPEETVLALVRDMCEWESWANSFNDLVFGDVEDDSFDEDEFDEECDRRYYKILDRYALDRSVCKGISFGDPTNYDPNEKIISSEINGDEAIIRTKQTHRAQRRESDANYEVIFCLRKVDDQWKITDRKYVDSDGEVFDVGI